MIHATVQSDYDDMKKFEANRIVHTVGGALSRRYKGYRWLVDVNMDGGIVSVFLPIISNEYGMQIHLDKHTFDLEGAAIKAGGELLERFNLHRSHDKGEANNLQRDMRGNAITAKTGGL